MSWRLINGKWTKIEKENIIVDNSFVTIQSDFFADKSYTDKNFNLDTDKTNTKEKIDYFLKEYLYFKEYESWKCNESILFNELKEELIKFNFILQDISKEKHVDTVSMIFHIKHLYTNEEFRLKRIIMKQILIDKKMKKFHNLGEYILYDIKKKYNMEYVKTTNGAEIFNISEKNLYELKKESIFGEFFELLVIGDI